VESLYHDGNPSKRRDVNQSQRFISLVVLIANDSGNPGAPLFDHKFSNTGHRILRQGEQGLTGNKKEFGQNVQTLVNHV